MIQYSTIWEETWIEKVHVAVIQHYGESPEIHMIEPVQEEFNKLLGGDPAMFRFREDDLNMGDHVTICFSADGASGYMDRDYLGADSLAQLFGPLLFVSKLRSKNEYVNLSWVRPGSCILIVQWLQRMRNEKMMKNAIQMPESMLETKENPFAGLDAMAKEISN